jgi:hypothetical protein
MDNFKVILFKANAHYLLMSGLVPNKLPSKVIYTCRVCSERSKIRSHIHKATTNS